MSRRELLRSALIFAITAACLTAAVYRFAVPLLDLLLPLYRIELQWLMSAFHIDNLAWRIDRDETVVALTVSLTHPIVVLGRIIPTGASIDASTLAAHIWIYPVFMSALAASWPNIKFQHRFLLMFLTLPFTLIGMLFDVPFMLWGAVEDLLYWQIDHTRVTESWGSRVQHFLDGGGRYALAIGLALLAIVLFRIIMSSQTITVASSSESRS